MNVNKYIVELKDIVIQYQMKIGTVNAVNNTSLNIERGKITALVGESGSGKTTLASSILGCITSPGKLVGGEVIFNGINEEKIVINELSENELSKFRWDKTSMVFQAAQSSLNPVMTVWESFYETYHHHYPKATKEEILQKSTELLEMVKLDVNRVLDSYPHELSGGMKQRVMIAFSMLLDPEFIILDEPTTALDVITQDYIFRILREINITKNITMLLMTHDLNVVAKFSDFVGVMYAGKIVEYGPTSEVFKTKKHPYTEGLINATPSLYGDNTNLCSIPGNPPDLKNITPGCLFCLRCKFVLEECKKTFPKEIKYNETSFVSCHKVIKELEEIH